MPDMTYAQYEESEREAVEATRRRQAEAAQDPHLPSKQHRIRKAKPRKRPGPRRSGPPPSTNLILSAISSTIASLPPFSYPDWSNPAVQEAALNWHSEDSNEQASWSNPYARMFGSCPFDWEEGDSAKPVDPAKPDGPIAVCFIKSDRKFDILKPPHIKFTLPSLDIAILGRLCDVQLIHSSSNGCAFRGSMNGRAYLLKLFAPDGNLNTRFNAEIAAYTNVLNADDSVRHVVPGCIGSSVIPRCYVDGPNSMPWFGPLRNLDGTGDFLMLMTDFIEDEQLETANITVAIAQKALEALAAVHRAGIVHGDVRPRHFLLCGEKVVLIDFDISAVPPHWRANLLWQWREMRDLWHLLFECLLPDKRAGIDRTWLYNDR